MGNVVDNRGKNKSSADSIRPSYARFYASKWRSGTLMLTLEEEGLYIRVSAFQMECGQPIPADWKEGARLLCVQPLKYRKTVDALIAKGKLVSTPEGIICERAMHEFKRASKGVDGDKQNPPTNPDTNPHTNPDTYPASMGVEAEKDEQKQTDFDKRREEKKEDGGSSAREIDPHELYEKLTEAANGSLYPLAIGLHAVAEPLMWIRQGADLDLDILPVIRDIAHKVEPQSISTWSYYARPVARQKKRREAGLPDVPEPAAQARAAGAPQPQFEDWRAKKRREDKEFFDRVLGGLPS
jgi:uncharacterized protein YdaU (DUF1376 family)